VKKKQSYQKALLAAVPGLLYIVCCSVSRSRPVNSTNLFSARRLRGKCPSAQSLISAQASWVHGVTSNSFALSFMHIAVSLRFLSTSFGRPASQQEPGAPKMSHARVGILGRHRLHPVRWAVAAGNKPARGVHSAEGCHTAMGARRGAWRTHAQHRDRLGPGKTC
jgi:hypothetical protein